jgi:transcriptional regulator with XRE-family HTH domain
MDTRKLTARARTLGAELRSWRERAGLEGLQVARRLNWSPAKVCNIESGRRGVSEVDAAMYLACCRTPGSDIKQILAFFHEQQDYWIQPHGEQLSDRLLSLITLETTATAIKTFELAFIPGLLQTEDYARALMAGAGLAPDSIAHRVRARRDRQTLLRRYHPPRCTFFIHESALRLPVGGDAIMNDQLLHLVFASTRPQVCVRVVPLAAGPHPGVGGAFTLLENDAVKPVVYVEHPTASLFFDDGECLRWYRKALDKLATMALDAEQSRSWLANMAGEHDRPREEQDDRARGERSPVA